MNSNWYKRSWVKGVACLTAVCMIASITWWNASADEAESDSSVVVEEVQTSQPEGGNEVAVAPPAPEVPSVPDEGGQPEVPSVPDEGGQPEVPSEPDDGGEPGEPSEPDNPEVPEEPSEPDDQEQPETPKEPSDPGNGSQTEKPSGSNNGDQSGLKRPSGSNGSGSPAKVNLDKEAAKLESNVPAVESDNGWSGDYLPGWAEDGQENIQGNLAVAEWIRIFDNMVNARVEDAQNTYKVSEDADVIDEGDNLLDIFAVYAVKNDMTDNFPYGVEFSSEEARNEIIDIFNGMVRVGREDKDDLIVQRLFYAEVAEKFELSEEQQAVLESIVSEDSKVTLREQYETSILSTLTDEEFEWVEDMIPAEVSGARRSVLLAGLSLNGKIDYFWGGKSYHVGWDNRWGETRLVTSAGVPQTGTAQTFGMDCSGFVTWAFINGGGDQNVLSYIGNGTAGQWSNSKLIGWDEVKPGDLLFYQTPNAAGINHVGIVVSNDDGDIQVVHCSGGGVAVTSTYGFQYAKTPYVYGE